MTRSILCTLLLATVLVNTIPIPPGALAQIPASNVAATANTSTGATPATTSPPTANANTVGPSDGSAAKAPVSNTPTTLSFSCNSALQGLKADANLTQCLDLDALISAFKLDTSPAEGGFTPIPSPPVGANVAPGSKGSGSASATQPGQVGLNAPTSNGNTSGATAASPPPGTSTSTPTSFPIRSPSFGDHLKTFLKVSSSRHGDAYRHI